MRFYDLSAQYRRLCVFRFRCFTYFRIGLHFLAGLYFDAIFCRKRLQIRRGLSLAPLQNTYLSPCTHGKNSPAMSCISISYT